MFRNWLLDALILSLGKESKEDYVGLREVDQEGRREAVINSGIIYYYTFRNFIIKINPKL